jgi:SSS family transporter
MIELNWLDWGLIAVYFAVMLAIGVKFAGRAKEGIASFFVSSRSLPWWLVGTSMVATTFSTDTPLYVAGVVRRAGISGNWEWWAFLLSGMLTVFFFARMWRRAQLVTDAEYYELRYSGKAASFLRGFRAVYLGLFINCLIMGSVALAMGKIGHAVLGWDPWAIVAVAGAITLAYTVMSGMWGVVVTDVPQFIMAMIGAVALAYYAVSHPDVGGLSGLYDKIDPKTARILPDWSDGSVLTPFLIMIGVQWWASWYPGAEPGGGGYIVQRVFACKDEKHSLYSTLWFNIAHYAVRPWPWILVALASIVLIQDSALPVVDGKPDHSMAYPMLLKLLPHGMLGLMFCSFLAAFMSTMDTHMNWGASYLVNDVYKRFVKPRESDGHYVTVSRWLMGVLTVIAGLVAFQLGTQQKAFNLLITIGAGTGLVYLLRWFWWRVNAWSEISAMVTSLVVANLLISGRSWGLLPAEWSFLDGSQYVLMINVAVTTMVWVGVTFATAPTDIERLESFYRKIRPAGPGWRPLRERCPEVRPAETLGWNLTAWVLGCVLVYSVLLGMGLFLEGSWLAGGVCGALALACIVAMNGLLRKIGWVEAQSLEVAAESSPQRTS